jgi:tellurite resistance protein
MGDRQEVQHATPAWLVPVVGLLDIPVGLPGIDLPALQGVMLPCIALGLFFAMPLFTMIFLRLLFDEPLPGALQPQLLILIAPFAVGFSAYVATVGKVDRFAIGLYSLTLFMLSILLGRLRRLVTDYPFRLARWSAGFPLSASASAAVKFAIAQPGIISDGIALVLLILSSLVITGMTFRTVFGIIRGELRVLSG